MKKENILNLGAESQLERDNELSNCTFVKTILMVFVVLYHSLLFWGNNWFTAIQPLTEAKPLYYLALFLNSFHIFGFTLVSGYLFYYSKFEKQSRSYQYYRKFIVNKALRLLIPYLFVSLVWAIPISVFFFKYGWKEIFVNFGLGVSPSQLWFLLMLFFVFMFFFPISPFIRNHNLIGGVSC